MQDLYKSIFDLWISGVCVFLSTEHVGLFPVAWAKSYLQNLYASIQQWCEQKGLQRGGVYVLHFQHGFVNTLPKKRNFTFHG